MSNLGTIYQCAKIERLFPTQKQKSDFLSFLAFFSQILHSQVCIFVLFSVFRFPFVFLPSSTPHYHCRRLLLPCFITSCFLLWAQREKHLLVSLRFTEMYYRFALHPRMWLVSSVSSPTARSRVIHFSTHFSLFHTTSISFLYLKRRRERK